MEYELNKTEIDLISECIKYRIEYFEGLLLLLEFQTPKQQIKKYTIDKHIEELRILQAKTTYIGQDEEYVLKRNI